MSWLRVEGRMPQHHKIAPLSDAAFRLHMTAMAWCVEGKTDGKVPLLIPPTLTKAPTGKKLVTVLKELTDFGVWIEADGAYQIHDFLQWNLSAAEIQARSEAKAKSGATGGKRSGEARAKQLTSGTEAPASGLLEPPAKTGEAKPKPLSLSQSLPSEDKELLSSSAEEDHDAIQSAGTDATTADCRKVFEFWQKEHGHEKAKFDSKRRNKIRARLRDGFTVRELCLAIRGAKRDPWLMGTDPKGNGVVYDEIIVFLRDTPQVERLIILSGSPRKRPDALASAPAPRWKDPDAHNKGNYSLPDDVPASLAASGGA